MSKPKPAEYDKFIKLLELASTNVYLQAILTQFHIVKDTEIATERKEELKILEELKVKAMS